MADLDIEGVALVNLSVEVLLSQGGAPGLEDGLAIVAENYELFWNGVALGPAVPKPSANATFYSRAEFEMDNQDHALFYVADTYSEIASDRPRLKFDGHSTGTMLQWSAEGILRDIGIFDVAGLTPALDLINRAFMDFRVKHDLVPIDRAPGMAFAGMEIDSGVVKLINIADCMFAATLRNGTVVSSPNLVAPCTRRVVRQFEEAKVKYPDPAEFLKERARINYVNNSTYLNNPEEKESYGALNGDPRAIKFLHREGFDTSMLDTVVLFTDGMEPRITHQSEEETARKLLDALDMGEDLLSIMLKHRDESREIITGFGPEAAAIAIRFEN